MKRIIMLGVLLAVGAASSLVARGYQPPAQQGPRVVEVEKLKDNLFMLKGGGGNTAVYVGANGVTVVDAKNPGWGQPILDKIKELTPKPVTLLVNTHTHGDHVSGNVDFPATVDIVVQENTKANMEKMPIFKDNAGKGLPKRTFKDKMTIGSGRDRLDLYYFGRGHTNGDAWVVFPELRVVHAADLFPGKNVPFMDGTNGGSGTAYPQTLSKAAEGIKNVDTIITGHSTTLPFGDLREYAAFVKDFVSWTESELKAGKSAEAAAVEYKVPEKYKGYMPGTRVRGNVELIYSELKK
ncbi:MAG TPA: MBL fold metallo-hydrolase [Vicinamibacterales bacterium]|jgi:glyoxylase-like metal-dependent hydrolase (beta-lactamase superfamily II)|nr:MBL fold metallo-hydrolase [Vicinamibacterales bacterium]